MRLRGCQIDRSLTAWISGWCLATSLVVGDVPLGGLLWLQGLDGNPPLPGFQVDGTLRMEAIDEPQDISLNISFGKVTNSVTGVINIKRGPGGARTVNGSVLNFGEMDINSVDLNWFGNSQCENHGTINVYGAAGFGFYGVGTVLDLEGGAIVQADSRPGYVYVQDGQLLFNGGSVELPLYVGRGRAKVGDTATNTITLNFIGPGCRYEGAITANRTLHLAADGRFGALSLSLTHAPRLDGAIRADAQGFGTPMALTLAPEGLFISAKGVFTTAAGGNGLDVTGNLTNAGTIGQSGSLRLSGDRPVLNTGSWIIGGGASLAVTTPLIQTGGIFNLQGGRLTAPAGVTVSGGIFYASGTLAGSLSNHATAQLFRNRPLTVTGDWSQESGAALGIQVAANDPSPDAAVLNINGHLNLAGPLVVATSGAVTWTPGQTVGIASVTNLSSLSGWFSAIQTPALPPGMHWTMPLSTNLFRLVTSTNAPALELLGQFGATNSYSLDVFGALGTDLVVEQSTNLNDWVTVTNHARFDGLARFNLPFSAASEQWFRARLTPAAGN